VVELELELNKVIATLCEKQQEKGELRHRSLNQLTQDFQTLRDRYTPYTVLVSGIQLKEKLLQQLDIWEKDPKFDETLKSRIREIREWVCVQDPKDLLNMETGELSSEVAHIIYKVAQIVHQETLNLSQKKRELLGTRLQDVLESLQQKPDLMEMDALYVQK